LGAASDVSLCGVTDAARRRYRRARAFDGLSENAMIVCSAILFPVGRDDIACCATPGPEVDAGGVSEATGLTEARPAPADLETGRRETDALGRQLVWSPALQPARAA
jgi:hypothetical protein